jgi:predicted dehydrogenase
MLPSSSFESTRPTKTLGVGLVGANWAARGHLPAWRLLVDHVRPVAICTTRLQTAVAAAARFSLPRAYHDFETMLDDPEIDIVSLGGPPPARYRMTVAALKRGKHVFSCVPFSVSVQEAQHMAALQRDSGLVGAVDAYFVWTPGIRYFKQLLDERFLGQLYEVSVDFSMGQFVDMRSDYAYRWTGDAVNGTGVLPNSCSHVFHTLIHLFGEVSEVVGITAMSKKLWTFEDGSTQVPQVADTAVILARLASGVLVNIHAGRAVPGPTGFRLCTYGAEGRLVCESPGYPLDHTVTITAARGAVGSSARTMAIPDHYFEWPGKAAIEPGSSSALSLGALFENFLRAIVRHEDALPSFARAAHVQAIIEAVRESERTRTWQSVTPERPAARVS